MGYLFDDITVCEAWFQVQDNLISNRLLGIRWYATWIVVVWYDKALLLGLWCAFCSCFCI